MTYDEPYEGYYTSRSANGAPGWSLTPTPITAGCTTECAGGGCEFSDCPHVQTTPIVVASVSLTDGDEGGPEPADHRLLTSARKTARRRMDTLTAALHLHPITSFPSYATLSAEPIRMTFAAHRDASKLAWQAAHPVAPTLDDARFLAKSRIAQREPLWAESYAYPAPFRWEHVGYGTTSYGRRKNLWQPTRAYRYVPFVEQITLDTEEPWLAQASKRYTNLMLDLAGGFIADPTHVAERIKLDTGLGWDEAQDEGLSTVPTWERDQARTDLDWFLRDELEIAREQRAAQSSSTQLRVTGDHWVGSTRQRSKGQRGEGVTLHTTGAVAEKAWLDARISQLRIDYRELARDARAKTGRRNVSQFAQLQALQRLAVSMRHRHNFRRYVEALGTDPLAEDRKADFDAALALFESRRRQAKLTYATANVKLEAKVTHSDRWIGVEGRIAA